MMMVGYAPLKLVCSDCDINPKKIKKLMENGLVRYKKTKNIVTGRPVAWVHIQDTKDVLAGEFPDCIPLNQAAKACGVTPKTIKFHMMDGRFRWKSDNRGKLHVCKADAENYYTHSPMPKTQCGAKTHS